MSCCLAKDTCIPPFTADVSARLVPNIVCVYTPLYSVCMHKKRQKDKHVFALLYLPGSHAIKLCRIGGMMDNSQGQRHNNINQILSDCATLDPTLTLHLPPMIHFSNTFTWFIVHFRGARQLYNFNLQKPRQFSKNLRQFSKNLRQFSKL